MLLETYSALNDGSLNERLPSFLKIEKQVTGDPNYSMFNLSLREDWKNSKKFCHAPTVDVKINGHAKGADDIASHNHTPVNS